ncbi:NAD(P)-dependent oxidoreductase [Vreelandella aquamarina]|uniref:NAD(P)-dependent oxidoreductase n=1 Tax=Vreelandella aquamarina TaxID=77097 RepID=UPI000783C069|nr:NAD(P)-dependent oxidoreductase [Halomonas axialensis]
MKIKSVAFIGAGNMGAPMARRTQEAGFDLIVCDRDDRVLEAFKKDGARVTLDASECSTADVIILLLANDNQIMEVLLGDDGLINTIPAGHAPIICIMSTTLPGTLNSIKDGFSSSGANILDAPISGGIVGAQNGTLTVMLGGDEYAAKQVEPVLRTFSNRTFFCGQLGAGEVVKIINNMICITNMFLTAEVVNLAERYGVSFENLSPILAVSTGMNFLTIDANNGRAQYQEWTRTEESREATLNVLSKDLHLALSLADASHSDAKLLSRISQHVDSEGGESIKDWAKIGKV